MIGYGVAKSAVHHLTRSLAKDGGLPDDAVAFAILPITLDTPMNRKWMPKADFGTWTPLEFVAEYVWIVNCFSIKFNWFLVCFWDGPKIAIDHPAVVWYNSSLRIQKRKRSLPKMHSKGPNFVYSMFIDLLACSNFAIMFLKSFFEE